MPVSALAGEVTAPGVPVLQGRGGAAGDQEWGSLKSACDQGPPGMCPRKVQESRSLPLQAQEDQEATFHLPLREGERTHCYSIYDAS